MDELAYNVSAVVKPLFGGSYSMVPCCHAVEAQLVDQAHLFSPGHS